MAIQGGIEERQMTDLFEITINGKTGNEVNTFRVESMEADPNNEGMLRASVVGREGHVVFDPERLMGCNAVLNF